MSVEDGRLVIEVSARSLLKPKEADRRFRETATRLPIVPSSLSPSAFCFVVLLCAVCLRFLSMLCRPCTCVGYMSRGALERKKQVKRPLDDTP